MVQSLAGIISLRRVLEANPGRSHGSADILPLRHSANYIEWVLPNRTPGDLTMANLGSMDSGLAELWETLSWLTEGPWIQLLSGCGLAIC